MHTDSTAKSNLSEKITVLNKNSSLVELFELSTPLMLVYENVSEKTNEASATAISPGIINEQYMTFSDAIHTFSSRAPHRHNFFELMYVLEGTILQTIEQETKEYHPGDCCILNKNISHKEDIKGNYKVIFLMLSEEFLLHLFGKNIFLYHENFLNTNKSLFYKLFSDSQQSSNYYLKEYIEYIHYPSTASDNYLTNLNRMINQIDSEIRNQDSGYLYIIEGLILRFFAVLENPTNYEQKKVDIESHSEELLLLNIIHILENKDGNIGRDELSRNLNYSGDYLNRIVKKYTGKSIIGLKNLIYLKKAEQLLITTDKPIIEIIDLLGFKNRSYFYKLFTSEYGFNPGNYRAHNKGLSDN